MDAVSFVVGVNTAALRGTKLADFRSNLASVTDEPTSVTLYYHSPAKDGSVEEIRFTRTITHGGKNEYRVDGKRMEDKVITFARGVQHVP
jgi:chromosome segregation ATPase